MNWMCLVGFLFIVTLNYGSACNPSNTFVGRLVFKVSSGSGINVLKAWTEGKNPNLISGDPEDVETANDFKGGWTDRGFLDNWKQFFAGSYSKVRYVIWNNGTTAVDITFDGRDSDILSWFSRERVLRVDAGPSVDVERDYNQWGIEGEAKHDRHFYVNKNYGGCENDFGFLLVSDTVGKEVCQQFWNDGRGWDIYPQFLYSLNKNGTLMKNKLGMGDTLTIAVI